MLSDGGTKTITVKDKTETLNDGQSSNPSVIIDGKTYENTAVTKCISD